MSCCDSQSLATTSAGYSSDLGGQMTLMLPCLKSLYAKVAFVEQIRAEAVVTESEGCTDLGLLLSALMMLQSLIYF